MIKLIALILSGLVTVILLYILFINLYRFIKPKPIQKTQKEMEEYYFRGDVETEYCDFIRKKIGSGMYHQAQIRDEEYGCGVEHSYFFIDKNGESQELITRCYISGHFIITCSNKPSKLFFELNKENVLSALNSFEIINE